ncbi:MAG TPA: lysylphosphatidylglycerol synthase transmembrane domain-containing protein [Thermomicrobiales bacterium]|nr:lysylphosphatidylglycerol synthase transmembrane domain-containing protein [Thermomicrobiales bacterium]
MARSRLIVPGMFWLGLAGAVVALWLSGQAAGAWAQVRGARWLPLGLVLAFGVALPLVHAVRWRLLMQALDADVPAGLAADVTVSSSLVNYAGPGFLGAPAKAFLANRAAGAPYGKTIVTMAFEQGLDFLVLLAGSAVALLLIGTGPVEEALAGHGRAARIALVVVVGRERIRRSVSRVIEAFRTLGSRIDWPAVAWCTAALWLLQAGVVAALLWALEMPATPTTVVSLSTIPLLLGQAVPLPGGIGVREAAIVALSAPVGISSGGLLGLAILQRVLLVVALPVALLAVRLVRAAK